MYPTPTPIPGVNPDINQVHDLVNDVLGTPLVTLLLLAFLLLALAGAALAIAVLITRLKTPREKTTNSLLSDLVNLAHQSLEQQIEIVSIQKQTLANYAMLEKINKKLDDALKANDLTVQDYKTTLKQTMEVIAQTRQQNADALLEVREAQLGFINKVNEHTDAAVKPLGVALGEARAENTAQHTGQGEDFKKMSDETARQINAHTDEKVDTNGDTTRRLIIEQLKSINDRMDQLQQGIETRDSATAQTLHQLSTDLSKAVLLMTAHKPEQPAAPAQSLPPVDPLANVPPKSEEMK